MNRSELIKRIKDDHAAFIQFIGGLSDEQLRVSNPNKWNAYQQAEHIYLCLRPIQLALRLPNWFPRLMFGKSMNYLFQRIDLHFSRAAKRHHLMCLNDTRGLSTTYWRNWNLWCTSSASK
jgi:hypothetical protein